MNILNEKENKLLAFIINDIMEKGYPPSIREMMTSIGVTSLRGVTYHLDELQRKGFLIRERKSRSITLLERAKQLNLNTNSCLNDKYYSIPFLGNIAAGNPIEASSLNTDSIPVSSRMIRNSEDYFALRVNGDSMILDHILDNDIVIIRKQNYAENGNIIVAVIDNTVTLKRLFKEKNYYRLQPSNPDYKPILVYGDLTINGVMAGLIREKYY